METGNATPRKPLGLSSNHEMGWDPWVDIWAKGVDLAGIWGSHRKSHDYMITYMEINMKWNWLHNLIYDNMKSWNNLMITWLHIWIHEIILYEISFFIWKLHMKWNMKWNSFHDFIYEIMKHEMADLMITYMKICNLMISYMKSWKWFHIFIWNYMM